MDGSECKSCGQTQFHMADSHLEEEMICLELVLQTIKMLRQEKKGYISSAQR